MELICDRRQNMNVKVGCVTVTVQSSQQLLRDVQQLFTTRATNPV